MSDLPQGTQRTQRLNTISGEIIHAAMDVHSALGPGLLESAYETCLCHELNKRNLKTRIQVPLPVNYDNLELDAGYTIDLLVEKDGQSIMNSLCVLRVPRGEKS